MGTLYLVRHADAGDRGAADGPDELSGLVPRGLRQATGLRDQLAEAGITRLLASPLRRCVDTLQPLADRLGLKVEADTRLAEGQGFAGALELAEEVRLATAVFCSHGDVIPDVLEALLRRGTQLPEELRCQKASTWALTRQGDGFSAGMYLSPPR